MTVPNAGPSRSKLPSHDDSVKIQHCRQVAHNGIVRVSPLPSQTSMLHLLAAKRRARRLLRFCFE